MLAMASNTAAPCTDARSPPRAWQMSRACGCGSGLCQCISYVSPVSGSAHTAEGVVTAHSTGRQADKHGKQNQQREVYAFLVCWHWRFLALKLLVSLSKRAMIDCA